MDAMDALEVQRLCAVCEEEAKAEIERLRKGKAKFKDVEVLFMKVRLLKSMNEQTLKALEEGTMKLRMVFEKSFEVQEAMAVASQSIQANFYRMKRCEVISSNSC